MAEERLPELPREFEIYLDKPYGGLFGDNVQTKIIEEVVADPYRDYRPKYLEEMTGAGAPTVRNALANLTNLGLLEKDISDAQHPIYRLNLKSKKIVALTFLSYASIDDRDGTECMDDAILDYYMKVLRQKVQPLAVATMVQYECNGRIWTDTLFAGGGQLYEENVILASGQA